MPIISHMGTDYDSPNVQIQDNASATDLDNTKVPTGQTIESYLNNNYLAKTAIATSSKSGTTSTSGMISLGLGSSNVILSCWTGQADICYPVLHSTYGWYAVLEDWNGSRKASTSVTVNYKFI